MGRPRGWIGATGMCIGAIGIGGRAPGAKLGGTRGYMASVMKPELGGITGLPSGMSVGFGERASG